LGSIRAHRLKCQWMSFGFELRRRSRRYFAPACLSKFMSLS
jgi:hypothetical protein